MRQIHAFTSVYALVSRPTPICSSHIGLPFTCAIARTHHRFVKTACLRKPNLKRLTSRIVNLTRRRQLHQIFDEIEEAKRSYGELNTIVMNAVMEACVHCGDIDSALRIFHEMSKPEGCGVDVVTYGTLLKGLGAARRFDEAFQLLESVDKGLASGSPKLSAELIYSLLNALVEAGDILRANGLLARYGFVLRQGGRFPVSVYNLLMKGYIKTGHPKDAIGIHDVILRHGMTPDRLTYNTLILACVKTENLDSSMFFFQEMKDKAQEFGHDDLLPDVVTYTTLLKGLGNAKDLHGVLKIVLEMKSHNELYIDRTAYTAIVDAFLSCDSIKDALCIFGEITKLVRNSQELRPKPHLYLSMMRSLAIRGDYDMVKHLKKHMWSDSAGTILPWIQEEANHLLMEAALKANQVDMAIETLGEIAKNKKLSWTSRGGMIALCIEAILGFSNSMFNPYLLRQISPDEAIENIMIPFEATQPLRCNTELKRVAMRFFRDTVVPVIDDWDTCVGLLHREDCIELNAPLSTMMRSPPPTVTTSTSISHVVDLILEKGYEMVVIVKHTDLFGSSYSSRAVGVFTAKQLGDMVVNVSETPGHQLSVCRR